MAEAVRSRYRLEDQIGFVLRIAVQFHTAIFTSQMIEGLTQTQFATLSKLREVGHCSQTQLARLLVLDAATTKGVVDRLELRGLVAVQADREDRRRRLLSLTPEGISLVQRAEVVAARISEATLSALTAPERARLVHLLRRMTNADPDGTD
jgi:DNA-binding MarR family transcriptional regulator